jgi:hypothetical protein
MSLEKAYPALSASFLVIDQGNSTSDGNTRIQMPSSGCGKAMAQHLYMSTKSLAYFPTHILMYTRRTFDEAKIWSGQVELHTANGIHNPEAEDANPCGRWRWCLTISRLQHIDRSCVRGLYVFFHAPSTL